MVGTIISPIAIAIDLTIVVNCPQSHIATIPTPYKNDGPVIPAKSTQAQLQIRGLHNNHVGFLYMIM